MYLLHLFDADDAIEPIEARFHTAGRLRIGRDRAADWSIIDPDNAISRAHLELVADGPALELVSVGVNGVFDEATGQRFPDRVAVPMALPCAFRLGRFRIEATEWCDAPPPPDRPEAALMAAFCAGAGIDPSRFAAEEPAMVLRRVGEAYRELVAGLGDLVAARHRAREEAGLPSAPPTGANPFDGGSAQRLAADLLLDRGRGSVPAAIALRTAVADVRRHIVAGATGHLAALRAVVARFAPPALDAAIEAQAGLMRSRAALQLGEAAARHADLVAELAGEGGTTIAAAYAAGYAAADR